MDYKIMWSVEKPPENYELKYLHKKIKKEIIITPKGKRKIINAELYPTEFNLCEINEVLKTYPDATLCCSIHKIFKTHGAKYIKINGSIGKDMFNRLNSEWMVIILKFKFEIVGTSEKFIDKLRISNWFLK